MYNIPYFKEKDGDLVLAFMRQHPFAMLIGCAGNNPVATQVPLLLEENNGTLFLLGHFMKNTDHHLAFIQNNNALCVFTGAHTYVSASLYTNPQLASTWNYMSVHVKGNLVFTDNAELLQILEKTTTHFENNEASPSLLQHLPKDYIHKLTKAIVGFRIEVNEINNVFKLSQNRDRESYGNIVQHLKSMHPEAQEIAEEMQKREQQIFK